MTASVQPDASTYSFDNDNPEAVDRHQYLARILDPFTFTRLSTVGALTGGRCLEIGAGGGSVASWLAERVGPTGRVVATDLNTRHLPTDAGYEVLRHDVVAEPVPDGPWDLIHTRMVLLHIPEPAYLFGDEPLLRQLLRTAVDVAGVVNDADHPITVTVSHDAGVWTVQVIATVAGPLSAERLLSMRIPHPDHPGEHRTGALALMLGREIAARHGGGMITSVEQRGVTVSITLPHS